MYQNAIILLILGLVLWTEAQNPCDSKIITKIDELKSKAFGGNIMVPETILDDVPWIVKYASYKDSVVGTKLTESEIQMKMKSPLRQINIQADWDAYMDGSADLKFLPWSYDEATKTFGYYMCSESANPEDAGGDEHKPLFAVAIAQSVIDNEDSLKAAEALKDQVKTVFDTTYELSNMETF